MEGGVVNSWASGEELAHNTLREMQMKAVLTIRLAGSASKAAAAGGTEAHTLLSHLCLCSDWGIAPALPVHTF